ISELNRLMQRLSRMGLRHNDTTEQTFLPPLRKPLYLCLRDTERAERLAQQLEYFGFSAQALADNAGFQQAMARRHPAAILMDIDFAGPGLGLALTRELQQSLRQPLPMLFFSEEQPSTPVRLAAVRAGGEELYVGNLDASTLLKRIEELTFIAQYEPNKELIVVD